MKKILSILILIFCVIVVTSCNNTKLLFDSELRELKFEYDSLVEKKEKLEEELAILESKYENYPLQIQELKDRLNNIDIEIEETYSLFSTLENDTLKGAVIVSHYLYDNSGFGIFSKDEIVGGSLGSGFVIKSDSLYYYILTNNHVIESSETADKESIYVYDYDLNKYFGTVVFKSSAYDMAVVRISKDSNLPTLKVMTFASQNPKTGDDVIAIGQPQGQVNSISIGKVMKYVSISVVDYSVIYHTAWIDHGNSGGMLLNKNLEVVGINTWGGQGNSYTNHESLSSPVEKIKEFLANNSFSV